MICFICEEEHEDDCEECWMFNLDNEGKEDDENATDERV